jgi:hypothetical protein
VAAKGDSAAVFDDWLIILVHVANPKILSYATPRGKVVSRVSAASVRAGQLMLRRRGEGSRDWLSARAPDFFHAQRLWVRAGGCRGGGLGFQPSASHLTGARRRPSASRGPGSNRFMRLETLRPSGGSLSRTCLKMPRRVVGTMA